MARCTETTKRGEPCTRYAVRGETVCPSHGGGKGRTGAGEEPERARRGPFPGHRRLSPQMRRALARSAATPLSEALREDIDLMRALAQEIAGMRDLKAELRAELMGKALERVSRLAVARHRVADDGDGPAEREVEEFAEGVGEAYGRKL